MQFDKLKNRVLNYPITGAKIYYPSFMALYVISFLKLTTYADFVSANWLSRASYLFVGLLLVKIYLFDDFKLDQFLINTLLLALALVTWRKSHAFDIVICAALILGARGINFQVVMDWFFKIGLLMLLYTIISSQTGVIKDLTYLRSGVTRHALGINYPTDFGAHVLYLVLAYCYLRFTKLTWKAYSGMAIIALILMVVTQARLDVYAILLTIGVVKMAQVARQRPGINRQISTFFWIMPILLSYLAVTAAYFYSASNHLFALVNRALSERLRLSHQALDRYGIHLFGNRVTEYGFGGSSGYKVFNQIGMGKDYFFIDSSLLRLFIIYGLVAAVLIIGVLTVISLRSILGGDYRLAAIIVIVAISSLIEPHLLDLAYNPFLIALLATGIINHQAPSKQTEVSL